VVVAAVLMVVLSSNTPAPTPNEIGDTPAAQGGGGSQPAGPGGSAEPAASGAGAGAGSSSSSLTSAERGATNVAVLNGTTQTGLAREVANKIQEQGFKIGSVATNADQTVPTTIVAFTAGPERAALAVARTIGVDRGSVQPADVNTTVAAEAHVVVTVGSDKLG
ncbi:MAG TPA: LytR C-terminal domain-containing protein, partial [Solirubrobacteraceae bacterium]|nr:LytR C-terminal domain-containing protein [Solirubrobacteraceae bacterium]